MTRRAKDHSFVAALTLLAAGVVFATRWPLRSHALFSWDSANFALATARVDIAAHRPHPPGYLGYVAAGRMINGIVHDPNTSLVIWNLIVTAIASVVVVRWAWEAADDDSARVRFAAAAGAIFITSPLLWFYGEVAEIYPSELLVALLVAFAAWRTIGGQRAGAVWVAALIALAAVFKLTAAVLIAPLAVYAWTRAPARDRSRSALLLALLLGVTGAIFLTLQPDLAVIIWRQFAVATSGSRVIGGDAGFLRALNINARDTFTAGLSALGLVNLIALIVWIAVDRRLPGGLGRRVAGLWLLPWVLLVLFVHIGRRGYILPLLPLATLVVAGFYARQQKGVTIALVALQAAVNVLQFVWLAPPPRSAIGGSAAYRDKTTVERLLSDLDAVTFPTAWTIAASDDRAAALTALVRRTCPSADPIIVAEGDWRRVLWYFPAATAIDTSGHDVLFTGIHTDATPIPADGVTLTTLCPVIWLNGDTGGPTPLTPRGGVAAAGVGAMTGPGTLLVTRTAIERR
ncbi:MAG TPA: hypothetical protein VJN96_14815 [Vicinamibacterales bacterium]|nr:hypothetical protein [Vicinamibacterales bacterium]